MPMPLPMPSRSQSQSRSWSRKPAAKSSRRLCFLQYFVLTLNVGLSELVSVWLGRGVREAKLFNSRAIIVNLLCPTQCNDMAAAEPVGQLGPSWGRQLGQQRHLQRIVSLPLYKSSKCSQLNLSL